MARPFAVAGGGVKQHACILAKRPIASGAKTMVDHAGSSAQRIRIGLTGLAFAFLLVLLASVISRSGQTDTNAAAPTNSAPNEPLAELGVAPGSDQANTSSQNR